VLKIVNKNPKHGYHACGEKYYNRQSTKK